MKLLHRPDLYAWSRFDESRNIDFHSLCWVRGGGNVLVDPLPLSPHDAAQLRSLGGAALIVITNSDHVRAAEAVAKLTGAKLAGPRAERETFPVRCELWLGEGDQPVPGLVVLELEGSKTPGELALLIEQSTLVTGDLVRAHAGGRLDLLPDAKLSDRSGVLRSLDRLIALGSITAVLPGDGWPVFRDGQRALEELRAAEARRHPPM
jgi:glyoxylase-like metal-dependent hydrolase (beta-lactamase superfamily II)